MYRDSPAKWKHWMMEAIGLHSCPRHKTLLSALQVVRLVAERGRHDLNGVIFSKLAIFCGFGTQWQGKLDQAADAVQCGSRQSKDNSSGLHIVPNYRSWYRFALLPQLPRFLFVSSCSSSPEVTPPLSSLQRNISHSTHDGI